MSDGGFDDGGEGGGFGGGGFTDDGGGFTESENQSYCSKMKDAIIGVAIGFLLFFGSMGLLVWNEGRTVARAKDLSEGRENYVEINLDNYTLGSYNDELIYTQGMLSTSEQLVDPVFGVSASNINSGFNSNVPTNTSQFGNSGNSTTTTTNNNNNAAATTDTLKLKRAVEMYQWKENKSTRKRKSAAGGTTTETTYTYEKIWSATLIDSSAFRQQQGGSTGGQTSNNGDFSQGQNNNQVTRVNPTQFPFEPTTFTADPINLGPFSLESSVVDTIDWFRAVTVSLNDVQDENIRSQLSTFGGSGFFYGAGTTATPQIGDSRITFAAVPADRFSVIAKVTNLGASLGPFSTSRDGSLLLTSRGRISAEELFTNAEAANTTLAWILRLVGFIMMVISITLILQPLATAVDIIPCVGDMIGDGMEGCLFPLIGCIISLPLCLLIIMISWIAYRPVFAIPIILVCAGLLCLACYRIKKSNDNNGGPGNNNANNNNDNKMDNNQNNTPYSANSNQYGNNANNAPVYGASAPYDNNNAPVYGATTGQEPVIVTTAVPVGGGQQPQQPQQSAPPGGGFASALDN